MGKIKLLAAVFAFMIMFAVRPAAAMNPISVSIAPDSVKTDLGVPAVFNMEIWNNENKDESLKIEVAGSHIYWVVNPIILLVVPRNSQREVNLTFYPVEYRGSFEFEVTTTSYNNPSIHETNRINLNIPPPIVVNDFSVSRKGSELEATVSVDTAVQKEIDLVINIINSQDNIVAASRQTYSVLGPTIIPQSVATPENMPAGVYATEYIINGNITGRKAFTVEPIHKVERSEKLVANPLYGEVIVTFKNSGNIAEKNYRVQQEIPADTITGFVTNPENCIEGEGRKLCDYVITDLQPGATAQISYRIEYWPAYVQVMAVALIVAIVAGFSFVSVTRPSIIKRSVKKGKNIHSVVLEVRNPFLHHLKDVVIRDWVSPLASVIQEEIDAVKPVIKRSEAGTELIWKLGDIRPKEVRILNYKIKTIVEGNLRMPRAYARFNTAKGKRFRLYSKTLQVE